MSILNPAFAFIIYLGLAAILALVGRSLAASGSEVPQKRTTYASGEAPPVLPAAPGYRPFFVIALFFAMLHLGVLVVASGTPTTLTLLYVIGLATTLALLILG